MVENQKFNQELKFNTIGIYVHAITEAKNTLHLLEIMFDIDYGIKANNLDEHTAETLKILVKARKNELK